MMLICVDLTVERQTVAVADTSHTAVHSQTDKSIVQSTTGCGASSVMWRLEDDIEGNRRGFLIDHLNCRGSFRFRVEFAFDWRQYRVLLDRADYAG